MAEEVAARIANLNPFKSNKEDEDDKGEHIGEDSIGHRIHDVDAHHVDLRVSRALKAFLADKDILDKSDLDLDSDTPSDALRAFINKPHIRVPPELTDRSHPLPEYFISSSHNTYLLAHQLYGTSCASAYRTAIRTGSRCVEIDAWDNSDNLDEPKVTHGYTLVSNIPFRIVCETIRDVLLEEIATAQNMPGHSPSPILLSLENHCNAHGQMRLVQLMKEIFGDLLLSKPIRDQGTMEQEGSGEHVTLGDLGASIAVIVEFHLPEEKDTSDSDSDDDADEEEEKAARQEYKNKKKEEASSIIIPELAELGVYAQSVKPSDNSWYEPGILTNGPHHHLINVSETGLASHLPDHAVPIAQHNSRHLMRVFPKGTRISSSNLKPVRFWGLGAQICALNWQTFGTSNQLNDALFSGTDGFVLKPAPLRLGGSGRLSKGVKKLLRLHIAGATDIPLHDSELEADSIRPYLTCTLYHPGASGDPPKRKTEPYRQHRLGFLHKGENPPPTDPVWDEVLEWEYDDSELVFVRMLIKSDESWARNPMFAALAVRLEYVTPGWNFLQMLDLKGRDTTCSILAKFEIVDA